MSSIAIWIGIAVVLAVILPIIFKDSWKNYVLRNVDRSLKINLNPDVKIIGDQIDLEKFFPPPAPPNTRIDKNVQFTVYRPAAILPDKEYPLVAFAHLTKRRADAPEDEPDPVKEVQRLATKILSDQKAKYEAAKLDEAFSVPQKGWLLFVPEIEGCTFNPPTQTVQWLNSVQKVEFGMTASTEVDGRDVQGQMTIYLGRTYLTHVPLRITVDSKLVVPESQQGVLEGTSAEPYRKVFASYSHKDTSIVEDFEAYGQALGDQYLRDVRDIRAGEIWSERLEELIRQASVFQLFWSSNSMTSDFVKQEWEYALGLNREKFIRGVYWEDPMPKRDPDLPPPALNARQFYKFPTVRRELHGCLPFLFKKSSGQTGTGAEGSLGPGGSLSTTASTHVIPFVGAVSSTALKAAIAVAALVTLGAGLMFVGSRLVGNDSGQTQNEGPPSPTPTEGVGGGGTSLPTSTITPAPSPSPSPSPAPSPSPMPSPSPSPPSSPTPTPSPSPSTPTPTPDVTGGHAFIKVTVDPTDSSKRGESGDYYLGIRTEGPSPIRDVQVEEILPKDLEYVSSDPKPFKSGSNVIAWQFPNLGAGPPNGARTIKVTVRLRRSLKPGESLKTEQRIFYVDAKGTKQSQKSSVEAVKARSR